MSPLEPFSMCDYTLMKVTKREAIMADYTGPERRHGERRVLADRRAEVRWEPGKDDRRQNPGRRKTDRDPTFWIARDSEK